MVQEQIQHWVNQRNSQKLIVNCKYKIQNSPLCLSNLSSYITGLIVRLLANQQQTQFLLMTDVGKKRKTRQTTWSFQTQ